MSRPPAALSVAGRVLLALVDAYRRWLSPLLPPRCRFYPSCSAYAREAVVRHGAVRGSLLALRRIARCQPFNPGGVDLVPDRAPEPGPAGAAAPAVRGERPC